MRFFKEIIAIIFIIAFIIISDIYVSSYTQSSIEKMDKKTDEIIKFVLNNEEYNKEDSLTRISEFEKDWKDVEDRLAYFAEHDELEKVSAAITLMKANMQMDMKEDAYEKMQEIKFRIEHIKTKQKFTLNNLF